MIGEWLRFGLCAFCVLGGLFAVFTAILGLFRFDFALNRLHASAVADTLGLGLMALGAAIAVGWSAVCWKLALVVVLQWCTLGAHAGPARIPDGRGSARASRAAAGD